MGYISNQIKANIGRELKQIDTNGLANQARTAVSKAGVDVDKIKEFKAVGAPVEAIKENIKLGDTTLNQLKLPAGVTSYLPKPVNDLLGGIRLPSEIGGVALPTLPDLSSATSAIENFASGIGFDTSIFKNLGLRDISSILKEPDMASIVKMPTVEIPTVEMPDVSSAYKDIDMSGLGADIESISQKFPEVNDLKNFL